MSKDTIRNAVHACFVATLPKRAELGNTEFRRTVMQYAMSTFSVSLAAAATHYNYALKKVKVEDPASVEGLGRPEDKKGGRKSNAERERIKAEKAVADEAVAQIALEGAAAEASAEDARINADAEGHEINDTATVGDVVLQEGAGLVIEPSTETTVEVVPAKPTKGKSKGKKS